jgi:hypothetical protein
MIRMVWLACLAAGLFACDDRDQCELYCEGEYEECLDGGQPADICASNLVACEQKCGAPS